MKRLLTILVSLFLISVINAQEKADIAAVTKIKDEGLKNSSVMNFAFHLTDVSGSRLTGSPGYMRAATWAKEE